MTESGSGFRSKFAALPGSLSAIRVDYNRNITAFDAPPADTHIGQRRGEIRRWRQGHRLGDKPEWSSSTVDEKTALFPKRPLMHTLSEFQAVKMDYSFRASTLPDVNKKTVFVPKPNKMQIDRTVFLSPKEKSMLVSKCPATVSTLSTHEIRNHTLPGVEREGGWNISTQPEENRTSVFKQVKHKDMRAITKAKGKLDPNRYISPLQRQEIIAETMREQKLSRRAMEEEARKTKRQNQQQAKSGSAPSKEMAFTMSNIDKWWDMNPVANYSASSMPASARGGGTGGNNQNGAADDSM